MVNKKLQVWLPLLFAIVMILGMFIGFQLREKTAGATTFLINSNKNPLDEIISLIQSKYVDNIKTDSLDNLVVDDVLGHLDPHSVYIPAKDLQGVTEDLQGNFQGIGVEFQIFNDTVNIMNVIADGPSFKAGVQVGDKIIRVNDTANIARAGIAPDDVRKLLRGPAGTEVTITVLRDNQQKKITIKRGTIPLLSVDAAYLIAPQTGYIRINKFSETTYEEFMRAMESLKQKGMKKLILDLRGNGGGFMNEAVDIADEFLDADKMIVYTLGSKVPKAEYRCKRNGLFESGKLAVLVDETSASASEILSGALQDWDRATIIGRRTFGKGLVQQQFRLSEGSALRLTIARYYTPLGRNIQKPYNKGREQYEEELIERFHDGEVVTGDTSTPAGKVYTTPGGRKVYGGGGITPDIFVPFDTTSQPQEVIDLYVKNILNNFVYRNYIQNKKYFNAFKTPQELYIKFHPGESEWKQLVSFAGKDSVDISKVSLTAKADLLKKIQALTARQIWRTEGFYEISNPDDPIVKRALEAVK